jgi:hypothetical protein
MEDVGGIAQFQNVPRSFLNTAEEAAAPAKKNINICKGYSFCETLIVNFCKGYSFRKRSIVNDVRDTASVKGSWSIERHNSDKKKLDGMHLL